VFLYAPFSPALGVERRPLGGSDQFRTIFFSLKFSYFNFDLVCISFVARGLASSPSPPSLSSSTSPRHALQHHLALRKQSSVIIPTRLSTFLSSIRVSPPPTGILSRGPPTKKFHKVASLHIFQVCPQFSAYHLTSLVYLGFTVLDNVYSVNGTIFLVNDQKNRIPHLENVLSAWAEVPGGQVLYGLPTDNHIRLVTRMGGTRIFGHSARELRGTTWIYNNPMACTSVSGR
jgi:hypothetical protein